MRIFSRFNLFNRFKKQSPRVTVPVSGSRPVFRTATSDGCVIHSEIPVLYKDGNATLFMSCEPSNDASSYHMIRTEIKDSKNKKMGRYSYLLDSKGKKIACGFIMTLDKFRHKGIAEILRLSSIMEIKENKISALEILALPDAIPFHSKYKFKPNLETKDKTLSVLDSIVNKTNADEKYKKAANKYIEIIKKSKFMYSLNPKCIKSVNKFMERYIEGNKNNWDKANFGEGLPMILTGEQVKKNSGFFNGLFKKHGIDYTV